MNVLVLILIVLALWRGLHGMKRGMVDEVGLLISLVISLFVLSVGILLYTSIKEKNTENIVISVIVLLITGIAVKLINLFVKAFSAIAHLPVISLLNKALGFAVGVLETVILLWIVYVVIGSFHTGRIGTMILEWTYENPFLLKLYDLNLLAHGLSGTEV